MNTEYSRRARKSYRAALPTIQRSIQKQISFLSKDLRHPSLHAKKYDESQGVWQARITRDWRMYFIITDGRYYILDFTEHP